MKLLKTVVIASALALSTSALAGDYITNYKEIVKQADWKTMETLTIEMDEFAYSHDEIRLKAGQPYKMELKNSGEKKHYFTAPEFYKSIATRKAQSNKDGEIKAPYFTALEMMADGGQLDLYFVPVTKGTYPVYCTIDDHREEGMEATIIIE